MLFNSYSFIFLFLPLVLIGYFIVGRAGCKLAAGWLALTSLFFYAYWDASFLTILLTSILYNYSVGRLIEKANNFLKKVCLCLGISGNILLLGYYKYASFLLDNINEFFQAGLYAPALILPIGISFFTFTQTAYLVDLYRGTTKNVSFVYYLEFVTIFPHLIAGPIIVHRDMQPQFINPDNLNVKYDNLVNGLVVFVLGLAKKVVVADSLAEWSNFVFSNAYTVSSLEAWIGTLAYTFQLYFDFSGYSEMAIGLGLMFNLKFPANFNSPYASASFIEFWRRWHMTLGLWVREYLYIPLGGNRRGEMRKYFNLFIAMLVIGIWHGAGWTFVFWGGMHGILLLLNHGWRYMGGNFPKIIAVPMTFLCCHLCWVFFRAESFSEAYQLIKSMMDLPGISLNAGGLPLGWTNILNLVGMAPAASSFELSIYCIATMFMLMLVVQTVPNPYYMLENGYLKPGRLLFIIVALLLLVSLMGMTQTGEFLYFQF